MLPLPHPTHVPSPWKALPSCPAWPACLPADEDNPLPNFIDPITMSTVVRPAISPYGYVAGLATWKVGGLP